MLRSITATQLTVILSENGIENETNTFIDLSTILKYLSLTH